MFFANSINSPQYCQLLAFPPLHLPKCLQDSHLCSSKASGSCPCLFFSFNVVKHARYKNMQAVSGVTFFQIGSNFSRLIKFEEEMRD